MEILRHLINLLVAAVSDRNRLAIENAVLRQQILVLHRGVKRVRLEETDRMFWIFLRRFVPRWRDLLFVDLRCARADLVSAAGVLERRLHEPDEALELLTGAWPDHPQAEPCLTMGFQLMARRGRHESAQALIRRLRGTTDEPKVVLALARCLAGESRDNADQTTRALAADSVRILCGKNLSSLRADEAARLIRSLTSTRPNDRLLARDGSRFLSRR